MGRIIRTRHGKALVVPLADIVPDVPDKVARMRASGIEQDIAVEDGKVKIPAELTARFPAPKGPLDHTEVFLDFGGQSICIQFLPDDSHHVLEAKHRWRRT